VPWAVIGAVLLIWLLAVILVTRGSTTASLRHSGLTATSSSTSSVGPACWIPERQQ
jgi:hypothetical protein